MKRRDFLKLTSAATMGLSVAGIPVIAYGQDNVQGKKKLRNTNGKILVLVRLNGGNDGLNTVIPLDRYSELASARASLLIPSTDVLSLNGQTNTGLHPAMTDLQAMYNAGKINIVQGVSYPNPDYSHFRATDIYASGSDSNMYLNSGWVGRFLDNQFPGAPAAYPSPTVTDPLSIEIGSVTSSVLVGGQGLNGFTISDIDNFYDIVSGTVDPAPATKGGNELTYIRFIAQQAQAYNSVIQDAALVGTNSATVAYPSSNLADSLKIVARLISGGLETPIYIVNINGFDTHADQVDTADHKIGNHANLLADLSSAIGAFQQDLEIQNLDSKVVGLTFSEFGRRIIANGSNGTDHGESAPMIVFGSQVNNTVLGTSPLMPAAPTVNDNLPMQFDFRQVYSTILTDWFGLTTTAVNSIMNGNSYAWLPIFSQAPLAVKLKDFTVEGKKCDALIKWQSGEEKGVKHYDVLHATGTAEFTRVKRVEAIGSNNKYECIHANATDGINYYKLRIIDNDGNETLSNIVSVKIQCNDVATLIYPNPADATLNVDLQNENGMVLLAIVDVTGTVVKTQAAYNSKNIIDTSKIPDGIYTLVKSNANNEKESFKIVVNHR